MGSTAKGQANGLASLGATGRLPSAQAPQAVAVPDLVATVGTADGTLADVGGAFSQATLNNNFRDLSDKVNALLAALRTAGTLAP